MWQGGSLHRRVPPAPAPPGWTAKAAAAEATASATAAAAKTTAATTTEAAKPASATAEAATAATEGAAATATATGVDEDDDVDDLGGPYAWKRHPCTSPSEGDRNARGPQCRPPAVTAFQHRAPPAVTGASAGAGQIRFALH